MTRDAIDVIAELDSLIGRLERRNFQPPAELLPPARNAAQSLERSRAKQGSAKLASHVLALRMFDERAHKPS